MAYETAIPIGAGGMGEVFKAWDPELERWVALKYLRSADPELVERLFREARAQARVDHPCVCSVYDVGEDEGRPYIAMEYVDGRLLDRATVDLSLEHKVLLIRQVAEAVHAAHAVGLIHRDLTPGNIIVAETPEGELKPYVLDFGIARSQEVQGLTITGQVLGTPGYLSPEQACGETRALDRRTDVFSLGVVLYEMLALRRPFEGDTTHQVVEQILRQNPPDLHGIRSRVPRDLAVIAGKCLEKSATRRYATMAELAADLRRYVSREPIHARPPGTLRKLVLWSQRNRTKSLAAAGITMAFAVVSVLLAENVRANEKLADTITERNDAIGSLECANAALKAQRGELADLNRELLTEKDNLQQAVEDLAEQTRVAEEVADFQSRRLSSIDPASMGQGIRAALFQALRDAGERSRLSEKEINRTAATLESTLSGANFTDIARFALNENVFEGALVALEEFESEPLLRAQLLQSLVDTMRGMNLWERAEGPQREGLEIRRRELGPDHRITLESVTKTGHLLYDQGKLQQAEEQYRIALEGHRRVLGDEHSETLTSLANMAAILQDQGRLEEAEEFCREVLDRRVRINGEDHHDTLTTLNSWGVLRHAQGHLAEAEESLRQVVKGRARLLGDRNPLTLAAMLNLGLLLADMGRWAESEQNCTKAWEGYSEVLGDDHFHTLAALNSLGANLFRAGHVEKGSQYLRQAWEGRKRLLGEDHPDTLRSLNNLGYCLKQWGALDEAGRMLQRAIEGRARILGPDHPETLTSRNDLGTVRYAEGQFADAEVLFREVWDARRRTLGPDHPKALTSANNLGTALTALGRLDESEALHRETLAKFRGTLGDEHPLTLTALSGLATVHRAQGDSTGAIECTREVLVGRRRALGDGHHRTLSTMGSLVELLRDETEYAEALELASELLERTREGTPAYRVRQALVEELEVLLEEAETNPPDDSE